MCQTTIVQINRHMVKYLKSVLSIFSVPQNNNNVIEAHEPIQHLHHLMTFLIRNQSRLIYRLFLLDHHGARARVFSNLLLLLLLFYLCDHLPCSTAQIEEELPPPPTVNDGSSWGPRFNPSIAIIMVVLVSVFFLLGFFSVYIRRCAESRYPHHYNDPSLIFGGSTHRGRRGVPGLDASVINRFPTFPYSAVKGLKIGKGTLECAVCLNEFGDDETLRLIPKCSHVFHPACIDAWLAGHTTCPVCRSNLLPEPGETIPSMNIQILNPDGSPGQPEQTSNYNEGILLSPVDPRVGVGSPSPDIISANQMKTPRSISRSPVWKFFHRSHSTGHSLVQPGEDHERFTLRLPEEVRNQLMNSSLVRTKSCVVLRSPRRGFRSRSIGFFYEQFGRPSRPGLLEFCMTPPSFSKTRSTKLIGSSGSGGELTPPRNYLKSVRSPFRGRDTDGERSFDRLHNNNQV